MPFGTTPAADLFQDLAVCFMFLIAGGSPSSLKSSTTATLSLRLQHVSWAPQKLRSHLPLGTQAGSNHGRLWGRTPGRVVNVCLRFCHSQRERETRSFPSAGGKRNHGGTQIIPGLRV